jgi:hypothetical protein
MRGALEVAAEEPVRLDREPAGPWAQRMLAEPTPGQATVIYHSIVSQYLSDSERARLFETIRAADDRANLDLTLWPGGEDRRLARVGYQGTPVELL